MRVNNIRWGFLSLDIWFIWRGKHYVSLPDILGLGTFCLACHLLHFPLQILPTIIPKRYLLPTQADGWDFAWEVC